MQYYGRYYGYDQNQGEKRERREKIGLAIFSPLLMEEATL
jgi:hypothetical protein